ncbi:MAG: O-antigen ligase family protein [Pyrinomonadaceae bacterium]|nr:O-antigen ligase family protein [Sphingobacteriaceae bacterium]
MKLNASTCINLLLILGLMLPYFLFPFAFNYEVYINDHYLIVLISFVAVVIHCLVQIPDFKKLKRGRSVVVRNFALILFLSAYLFFPDFSFSNEYFSYLLPLVIVAFFISYTNKSFFNLLAFAFVLFWCYQVYLGLYQISLNSFISEPITGSLQNSGAFAIYIVTAFPLVLYLLFKQHCIIQYMGLVSEDVEIISKYKRRETVLKNIKAAVSILLLFVVGYLLIYAESRTALLSLVMMLVFASCQYYSYTIKSFLRKHAYIFIISFILLLAFSGYTAFYLFKAKELSAVGRIMIWEISFQHIKENFWFGVGPGWFTWYYPHWQSEYFKASPDTPFDYYLAASETYLAFNEPLQLFKSVGMIGFFFSCLSLVHFFRATSQSYKGLLIILKIIIIGILTAGLSSYPLHLNSILLLTIFCFAVTERIRDCKFYDRVVNRPVISRLSLGMALLLLVVAMTGAKIAFEKYNSVKKWETLEQTNSTREAKKEQYFNLNKNLSTNGKFLTSYGEFLQKDSADFLQAVLVLTKAKKYFTSYQTISALAMAYWRVKNYNKAIENFEWLSNYVPNKFGVKYELMKLYIESGDFNRAKHYANLILIMPVKIPSDKVDEIKFEVRKTLEELN